VLGSGTADSTADTIRKIMKIFFVKVVCIGNLCETDTSWIFCKGSYAKSEVKSIIGYADP